MRWWAAWAGWGKKRKVLELCKFVPLSSTLLHSCEEIHQLTLNLTPLEGQLILRLQQHENVKSTFRITHLNFSSVQQWVTFRVEESKAPFAKFRWVGSQSTFSRVRETIELNQLKSALSQLLPVANLLPLIWTSQYPMFLFKCRLISSTL